MTNVGSSLARKDAGSGSRGPFKFTLVLERTELLILAVQGRIRTIEIQLQAAACDQKATV